MVPLAVSSISSGRFRQALAVFAAVAATDALDGFLARRLNCITRLGAYLDPIADKALLSGVYLAMGMGGIVPWWLVWIVFGRDLAILAFAAFALLLTGRRDFKPSVWGKASTFVQVAAAIVMIVSRAYPYAGVAALEQWVPVPVAAMTAWSGIHYAFGSVKVIGTTGGR